MKKAILTTLLILLIIWSYAQQSSSLTNPKTVSAYDLRLKSKDLNIAGFSCLGFGTACVVIGIATFPQNYTWLNNSTATEDKATLSTLAVIFGASAMITSIPLLIKAAVLHRKARLMLAIEKPAPGIPGLSNKNITALSIRIPLEKFSRSH